MMSVLRYFLVVLLGLPLATPASACTGDVQCLSGKKILMRAKGTKERARGVAVLSTDPAIDLGGGNASADDPTMHDGTLRIFSAAGGFDDTYDLPADRWDYVKRAGENKGYKFRRTNPIKGIRIQPGKRIRVAAKGAGLGHDLATNPDPVTVVLSIGGKSYCWVFGGSAKHKPNKKFLAKKAAAPTSCPLPDGTTTTSSIATTSSTVTTTTSSTSTTSVGNQPPVITSDPGSPSIVLDEVTTQVDLSTWTAVNSTATSSGGNANWDVAPDGLSVLQTQNSNPGFFLSDFNLTNAVLDGTIAVETTGDDDYVGFVFGYQDPTHFYIFDWKQLDQGLCGGFANAGMAVKVVDADTDLACIDLWNTDGVTGRVTTLATNEIPWADNVVYGFTLAFSPGSFTITVRDGATVLDTIVVNDSTYTSGLFGFYNNSQNLVRYTGFTDTSVIAGNYFYDADGMDPDGDPLTWSLTQGPADMTIDPLTGEISWMPDGDDEGIHDVTVRLSDGRGGVDEQTYQIEVTIVPVT